MPLLLTIGRQIKQRKRRYAAHRHTHKVLFPEVNTQRTIKHEGKQAREEGDGKIQAGT